MIGDAGEHIGEVVLRIEAVELGAPVHECELRSDVGATVNGRLIKVTR
jgi:hypothetical protein